MPNPYALLAGLVLWIGSLLGVGTWMYDAGTGAQKVADQREFDQINTERALQKDQAAVTYRARQAELIAVLADRDKFKHQLEEERNAHRVETDALRARYAGLSLRFRAAEGAAAGGRGGRPDGAEDHAARADGAAVVQLPDPLAASLRQLAFDADRLAGEYATCYRWATGGAP